PVWIRRWRLIRTRLACTRRGSGRRVFDPRNGRGRCAHIWLGGVGLSGGMQLVAEFVFRFLKFLDGRAHPARQLRQLLRAEENENDQEDNDQVGSAEIPQKSEQAHNENKHLLISLSCKAILGDGCAPVLQQLAADESSSHGESF